MKLESFKDKKATRRKMILISLGVITIVGVSFLLYKTFASFSREVSFPLMSGKVNYYGDSDIIFAFYNGEQQLDEMPQKGNKENLIFERAKCDNGASVEWDSANWAPLVVNLTKTKTRCTLYFAERKGIYLDKDIPLAQDGQDGLYVVEHNDLTTLKSEAGWEKTEYRYAGVDPDNYVEFNNEKWRIIGLVNVKTESGVEQRVKIIRTDGIENQQDFGNYAWDRWESDNYTNNWTTSKLKDMLNGIYYKSEKGECYTGSNGSTASQSTCDFSGSGSLPKGLDDTAKNMLDSEVIWNIGGWSTPNITADTMYEKERGTSTGSSNAYPAVWTKENDTTYHNGLGIMNPSDYGYAVGGSVRKTCLAGNLIDYDINNCYTSDWLKVSSGYQWLLSPDSSSSRSAFDVYSGGYVSSCGYGNFVYYANGVWPVGYLSPSTTIYDGDGSINNPFKLSD